MGGMPLGRRVGKTKEGCELRESHLLYEAVSMPKRAISAGKTCSLQSADQKSSGLLASLMVVLLVGCGICFMIIIKFSI